MRPPLAALGGVGTVLGVVMIILGTALAGCGSGGPSVPSNCPKDLPDACPSPAPSFTADVDPIIQARCTACHSQTGQEAVKPLQTYQDVFARRLTVLTQLHACRMPPVDAPQLTPEERVTVQTWLVCGAPPPTDGGAAPDGATER